METGELPTGIKKISEIYPKFEKILKIYLKFEKILKFNYIGIINKMVRSKNLEISNRKVMLYQKNSQK